MQSKDNIFNQVTSHQEVEVFVSLPSSTRSCMNTNNFCFLSYSPDMTSVKMSAPIKITQWKSSDAPKDKKRKTQDEPEETTKALFSRLITTITQLEHDALFLKRLDDFMKRDAVKNAKIEEDIFIEKRTDMTSSDIITNNTSGINNNNNNNNSRDGSSSGKDVLEHVHDEVKLSNDLPPLFGDDGVN